MIWRLVHGSSEAPIKFIPYESFTGKQYEDVRRRVPNVSLCERVLGVRAKVGLEEGLARTIAWQRDVFLQLTSA
jgi:UDP-glucose 4-epimerase